jgi:hypothetical protein
MVVMMHYKPIASESKSGTEDVLVVIKDFRLDSPSKEPEQHSIDFPTSAKI